MGSIDDEEEGAAPLRRREAAAARPAFGDAGAWRFTVCRLKEKDAWRDSRRPLYRVAP
ncbi:hypothetical protein [Variovorax paradoxus]|uniref:hypothetical protein n=1 Tax=Variovorax paradoxus TaxID=34073 RepID=UPI002480E751|nr:hypothetical protein [Variovorax paradoxus]WGT65497.1 hypothetical protein QHG62_09175 [Variovorax paradoxus]